MILLCAATRAEYYACLKAISQINNKEEFSVLLVGVGPIQAEKALRTYISECRLKNKDAPAVVISTGFAGCLNAAAQWGTWVWAQTLYDYKKKCEIVYIHPAKNILLDKVHLSNIRPHSAVFVSSDHVLCSSDVENSDFLKSIGSGENPLIVDMESVALAQVCVEHKIPFSALRLVSDTPNRPLPEFVTHFTKALCQSSDHVSQRAKNSLVGLFSLFRQPKDLSTLVRNGFMLTTQLEKDLLSALIK
jgi:nucleoside phosphorylase